MLFRSIPDYVAKTFLGTQVWGMDIQAALKEPRAREGNLLFSSAFSAALADREADYRTAWAHFDLRKGGH